MRKWILALALVLCGGIPAAHADLVPLTDIAARSRLAVGVSRVFDENGQFKKDTASLFYNFGVTKHLGLAANVNYAFSYNGQDPTDQRGRFEYVVGLRFPLGVK